MMKNIFKSGILALTAVLAMTSCSPQDSDDHSLGAMPQESQLAFAANPTSAKPNVVDLKNESSIAGVATWDFGNGVTSKGETAKAEYPFAGEYTIAMTLYTTGGSATITKNITIANDDMSLLDTPMYNALTGGAGNLAGKTWVFDQYQGGHFGVFPDDNSWSWYAGANEKDGSSLYTQEFTFIQVGVKMLWENGGYVYTNKAGVDDLASKGYPNSAPSPVDDFDVEYEPNSAGYTFALDESGKTITLSGGAFFGHYAGTSTYKILKLENDVLEITCKSAIESGNNWAYRFVPKEKNVKPEIPVKSTPLSENFEGAKLAVDFVRESMGELDYIYSNPAPVPVNTSKKVYLYEKTTNPSSNISYTASGYKFDLTTVNKIRMKVYIPSYNDYTTVVGKEDWGGFAQLQKQVEVKLHNSDLGGDAWQSQVVLTKKELETDKWIDLEFDFSAASERKDLDKIVIQFGAEGHYAPGIFFFDDFSFDK